MPHFVVFKPSIEEKKFLLDIARKNIESWLDYGRDLKIDEKDIPPSLEKKMASFVTLTKNNELRGCIGTLIAKQSLYLDVMKNAYLSAFKDNRFFTVTKDELPEIIIEISILTDLERIYVQDESELISRLSNDYGLYLKYNGYQATFLPSVWEKINSKEMFLSQLKLKAGIDADFYNPKMEYYFYKVEKIEEF